MATEIKLKSETPNISISFPEGKHPEIKLSNCGSLTARVLESLPVMIQQAIHKHKMELVQKDRAEQHKREQEQLKATAEEKTNVEA